jgi:hypothetical protein
VVYFENETVSRVLARYRKRPAVRDGNVTPALIEAWQLDLTHFGVVRRVEQASGRMLQGFGFHDDQVRVRLFGQTTSEGPELYAEWRRWPVESKTTVAARP